MGFLLLQYEYQRANSKVSHYEAAGIRLNNKLNTLTKRVEKMQKAFEKQKTNIDNKWNQFEKNANSIISNATQTVNIAAGVDATTATSIAVSAIGSTLGGIVIGGINLAQCVDCTALAQSINMASSQQSNDPNAIRNAMLNGMRSVLQQASAIMNQLVNDIKEAQTNMLEAQEDEQMAPINDKQMDLESDKTLNDTLTEEWKTRRDNAKEHLGEGIKNSMAGFGIK